MAIDPTFDPNKYTDLMIVVGSVADGLTKKNALTMARWLRIITTKNSTASITMSIHGYDDDPRELGEIPEAVQYIRWFADELHRLGLPPNFVQRLTPESLRWRALD